MEEVRVGLLSFQRELGLIKSKVESRRHDVATLMEDKRSLKQEIMLGRALLEIAERIEDLEGHLMIGETTRRKSDNGLLDGNTDDGAAFDSFSEDSDEEDSADEYRPLRPRVRSLCALHEPDSPLSRPADPPRDLRDPAGPQIHAGSAAWR